MEIKTTSEGIAIVIPYQDNANYKYPALTKGYAHDVIGSWSPYLIKVIEQRKECLERVLLNNIGNLSLVSKCLIITNDGQRFALGTYGSHLRAIAALKESNWSEFLRCYVQITQVALMTVKEPNPEKMGTFTLNELINVLGAADHDCIESI